jgi:PilZ domain-containing protein
VVDTAGNEEGWMIPERRKPRRTTHLRGLIVLIDGSRNFECRIEDVSLSGARIFVDAADKVPAHCYLLIAGKEVAFEANMVWSREHEYGLKFANRLPLVELRSGPLQFLRQLKLELLRT